MIHKLTSAVVLVLSFSTQVVSAQSTPSLPASITLAPSPTPTGCADDWTCHTSVAAVPECALGCFSAAAPQIGCEWPDQDCICPIVASIFPKAAPCNIDKCGSLAAAAEAVRSVRAFCDCVTATPSPTITPSSCLPAPTPFPGCPQDWPCHEGIDAIPDCAVDCFAAAAPQIGCTWPDQDCLCPIISSLFPKAAVCNIGACGLSGAGAAVTSVRAFCDCATATPFPVTTPATCTTVVSSSSAVSSSTSSNSESVGGSTTASSSSVVSSSASSSSGSFSGSSSGSSSASSNGSSAVASSSGSSSSGAPGSSSATGSADTYPTATAVETETTPCPSSTDGGKPYPSGGTGGGAGYESGSGSGSDSGSVSGSDSGSGSGSGTGTGSDSGKGDEEPVTAGAPITKGFATVGAVFTAVFVGLRLL